MNARTCLWISLAFFAGPAFAQLELGARVPPGGGAALKLQSLVFNGSGCPSGFGARYEVQGDVLWLSFPPDFSVDADERRKNCIATLRFASSLQSYAIESLAFAAGAALPDEANLRLNVNWFYEGQGLDSSFTTAKNGPFAGEWITPFSATFPASELIWKPCGLDRALNINSSLLISAPAYGEAEAQFRVLGLRFKRRNCVGSST